MTKKPHSDTRLAKYVERRVLELKPTKSQAEIAALAGYPNANMITMIKQGIPEACKFYEVFRNSGSDLVNKCAIVTSYKRMASELTGEEAGMGETEKQYVYKVYDQLLGDQNEEDYEEESLRLFKKEPARMKLLIVVSRLLTGFDAPTGTYIYIDKQMRDHGLFQAICRVNRLDGDDKDFGYIVDYKDLFKNIESAVDDYTSEAFDKEDVEGLISDRAEKASEDLQAARDAWFGLMDAVEQPKGDEEVYAYFSSPHGIDNDPDAEEKARRRQVLYKIAGRYARAFAKGRAIVPMTEGLRKALLEARKAALSDYVVEWAGGPVKSIKKGFKAAAVEAGLPDVSPHVLRHTAAVHMAEAGISMDEIAQYLGHSDSRITASTYARYSPEHLRKAANALEFD